MGLAISAAVSATDTGHGRSSATSVPDTGVRCVRTNGGLPTLTTGTNSRAKARAGVIPIVSNSPEYISYGVMFQDMQVMSISQWEYEKHARAPDQALGEWVKSRRTQ